VHLTTNRRAARRGSALAAAMMFFVMITIAATALLSISAIHRIQIVRNGIDVRLMIAAEAGIETVRGRFVIVQVIQEDWSALMPTSDWNIIEDSLTVNGIGVIVEARPVGAASVPMARIRSTATSGTKARTVEYTIRVASFSDFSLFNSNSGLSTPGVNYKAVGNAYYGGNVRMNTGVQFFGNTYIVGNTVADYGVPGGSGWGAWDYHFPYHAPTINHEEIPLPGQDSAAWDALEWAAENAVPGESHLYGENTLGIELLGDQYRRYYVQRYNGGAGAGTVPSGPDWLNWSAGTTPGPAGRIVSGASSINNVNYRYMTELLPIPDDGVIYVKTGSAQSVNAGMDVFGSGTNNWVQTPSDWGSKGAVTGGAGGSEVLVRDYMLREWPFDTTPFGTYHNTLGNGPFTRILLLWGYLDDTRVSIGSEHNIVIASNIYYQTLYDNPELRAFHGDQASGKESPAALAISEMLGVMSQQDIQLATAWWSRLPTSAGVPQDIPGDMYGPSHRPNDTYSIDGVYFALGHVANTYYTGSKGELWMHGGVIGGQTVGVFFGAAFQTRNYHWDYRMQTQMPPYFLRAYNASAVFMPGTWRTYES